MDGLWRGVPAVLWSSALRPARGPVVALVLTACFDPSAFEHAIEGTGAGTTSPDLATDTGTSTGADAETTATDGVDSTTTTTTTTIDATTTSAEATDGAVTAADTREPGSDEASPPPQIHAFTVAPEGLHSAGPLTFSLECTHDVISVEIIEETLGSIAVLDPADFPFEYVVTGDEHNDHGRFRAFGRDLKGTIATSELAEVDIGLSPPGLAVWTAKYGEEVTTALSVVPYLEGAVAVGYRFKDNMVRAVAIRFDEEGQVMWERTPELMPGYAAGVAILPDQRVAVVGNRHVLSYQAMWVRILDGESGEAIPEASRDGGLGERGLAIAAAPSGVLYVAGDVREEATPTCRELRLRRFGVDEDDTFTKSWSSPPVVGAPCLDDQALALTILEDGDVAVVGATSVPDAEEDADPDDDDGPTRPRLLALRFTAAGSLIGTFIDDDSPYRESQGWSVASDRAGGMLVGGRTGPRLAKLSFPVVHRLDAEMQEEWWRILPGGGPEASADGIAMSLDGDVVVAATVFDEGGDTDILLGELDGATGETWRWQSSIDIFALDDRAHHLAQDEYGTLYLAGVATLAGGPRALVRKITP